MGPDNVAYTGRNLSTVFALNPDGGVRWRYVDPGILFEPVVSPSNSLVFMGGLITFGQPGFFLAVGTNGVPRWRIDLPDEPGFAPYGQLVPSSRPAFTPDGRTAYVVVEVAGDGSSPNKYSFLYAIDTSESGGGEGPAPAAPTPLSGSAISSRWIDLTWTDNSAIETGFRIEQCTGNRCKNFVVVGNTDANVTAFTDTGLASRTSYRYRARSYNATGVSAPSNAVRIRTR